MVESTAMGPHAAALNAEKSRTPERTACIIHSPSDAMDIGEMFPKTPPAAHRGPHPSHSAASYWELARLGYI